MNSASQVYKLHITTPLLWVLIRELFLPPHRFNLMSMFFISWILGARVTKLQHLVLETCLFLLQYLLRKSLIPVQYFRVIVLLLQNKEDYKV